MNIRKSDVFIADLERQFEWYVQNAGQNIADQPQLGPQIRSNHPRLRDWRFFVIFRPFRKHVLFYEQKNNEIIMRRVMHGHRDLPRRLLEKP